MARKNHPQQPHYGVQRGLRREQHIIIQPKREGQPAERDLQGLTEKRTFMPKGQEPKPAGSPSISSAKRYMRTGKW